MLSSSTTTTTSPIFYVDNIVSYLIDDDSTNYNYSTSYYHLPSPLIYNEIDNYISYHDELAIIQQSLLANSISNNNCNSNSNSNNNNNSSMMIDHTEDYSSILEVDNKKVDYSNKGDDHEAEINGIVEDNGHNIMNSHHILLKKKKKRTSNKDRHSKIKTAHGIRDRRMRLSLQVARPFFKLQDMLGYDKASTTVEWLMIQSKPAIDELLQAHKHGSPSSGVTNTTKCTTMSSNSDECDVESTANEGNTKEEPPKKKEKRKRTTKEERKVARERAKQRTLERMQSRGGGNINNPLFTTSSSNYQQQFFYDVCQNATSYRNSAHQCTMGGPQ